MPVYHYKKASIPGSMNENLVLAYSLQMLLFTHVLCYVYSIHVDSLDIPTSSLSTSAGKGLTLQASGISVKISANWYYKLKSM